MKFTIKRAYDPASKSDGKRILVDRLWPRGVSKEEARIALWLKDAAPSRDLVAFFHADKEKRWKEFNKHYSLELRKNRKTIAEELKPYKSVTIVTAVKDLDRSHIPALKRFLERL